MMERGEIWVSNDYRELIRAVQFQGFAFRERLSPRLSTEMLAHAIGEPVALGVNPPVHPLTPKSTDEAPFNTYSGNYGLGDFPLHTDLANWYEPPHYLMLRCVVGAPDVATTIVDPWPAINAIGIQNLARALMKPRRRVAGRMTLLPLMHSLHDDLLVRWDARYLQPASRAGELFATQMGRYLHELPAIPVILAQQGDTIIIDNWRMLHGRAAVPEHSRSRHIERVYLKALA